jgi:hypothetical protein
MKNLEKDLEILKQFYDEELKFMRIQIEELSLNKNKLSLDNYNLEEKLKDFIIKYPFICLINIKKNNSNIFLRF